MRALILIAIMIAATSVQAFEVNLSCERVVLTRKGRGGVSKAPYKDFVLSSTGKNANILSNMMTWDDEANFIASLHETSRTCGDQECTYHSKINYKVFLARVLDPTRNYVFGKKRLKDPSKAKGILSNVVKISEDIETGELSFSSVNEKGETKEYSEIEEINSFGILYTAKRKGLLSRQTYKLKCRLNML